MYPKLAGQDAQYLLNQTQDILSGARGGGLTLSMRMSAYASEKEIKAISDYLATVKGENSALEKTEAQSQTFDDWNAAVVVGGFRIVKDAPVDQSLMKDGDFRKGDVNKNELPANSIFYDEPGQIAADRAEQGKTLYLSKACVGCHGTEGRDPPIPGYPSLAGQNARYGLAQMQFIRDGSRTNGQAMAMKGIVVALSDSELHALADYLASVAP
jgi:cytochrome c553